MKRSQIKRRPLADSVLNALEPEDKDYTESDTRGLYFRVKSSGTKSWLLRYKSLRTGKWAWKGLGGYPSISGKKAREIAGELLTEAANGKDISRSGVSAPGVFTVAQLIEHFMAHKRAQKRSANTIRGLEGVANDYVLPTMGSKECGKVTRLQCSQLIRSVESSGKLSMAVQVRKFLTAIYSFGIASGYCDVSPASELRHIAIGYQSEHHPFLQEAELGDFLVALRNSLVSQTVKEAIRVLLGTLIRPQGVSTMVWSEVSLEDAVWAVPASKMKMRTAHVMPLPTQLVSMLRDRQELDDGECAYVFNTGLKCVPLATSTVNRAIHSIGYQGRVVAHGLRHTASTLLREHGWDKSLVEAQLSHAEGGVAGVYNKAIYIDKRREMMQWYVDYIEALETSSRS